MRGKVHRFRSCHFRGRITPAYAGKRALVKSVNLMVQDHPRLCGEKLQKIRHSLPRVGSPPPMRGKASLDKSKIITLGITPAYAGKSYGHNMNLTAFKDHPRLCGEKFTFVSVLPTTIGSPPPMRGKVLTAEFCT